MSSCDTDTTPEDWFRTLRKWFRPVWFGTFASLAAICALLTDWSLIDGVRIEWTIFAVCTVTMTCFAYNSRPILSNRDVALTVPLATVFIVLAHALVQTRFPSEWTFRAYADDQGKILVFRDHDWTVSGSSFGTNGIFLSIEENGRTNRLADLGQTLKKTVNTADVRTISAINAELMAQVQNGKKTENGAL